MLPASAKTLVPLLRSVPMRANHSPPLRMMGAMLAKVSTLLISVGMFPQARLRRDRAAGDGAFRACPSMEAISAVSSPHTNAPAPSRI